MRVSSLLKNPLLYLCFLLVVVSCKKESVYINPVITLTRPIKSVVILGNSIVRHTPDYNIGWYGDWGMAASSIDHDFVHILIRNIHQKDSSVNVRYANISDFEKNFTTYAISNLDSFANADMLILRISENVDDQQAADNNFPLYYDKLISYLTPKTEVTLLVDGFWPKYNVNPMILQFAKDHKYPFVENADLFRDPSNQAGDTFSNPGVAIHPSDKGMQAIADRIWNVIKIYF